MVASGASTATAGLSATNLQSNDTAGGVVNMISASLTAGVSALFTTDGTATVANTVPLTGATVALDQNALKATATGNSASNALALSGSSSASASAALANLQVSTSAVTADTTATQGVVGVLATSVGATTASNLTVSGNAAKALAVGTSATNALSVDSSNLTGNSKLKTLPAVPAIPWSPRPSLQRTLPSPTCKTRVVPWEPT